METIAVLLRLQELDGKIRSLRVKIDKREEDIRHLRETLERSQQEFAALKVTLEKAKVALAHKELELKDTEEKLKAAKGKLYSGEITSSKELSQWEKSMEKLETTKGALEEEILLEMDKLESLQKTVQEKSTALTLEREKSTQAISAFEEEIQSWKATLSNLEAERQEVLAQLDAQVAVVYRELCHKYPNPVVPLNDETCTGCHLSVPTTVAKSVRKQQEPVRCPNCGRFLYRQVS